MKLEVGKRYESRGGAVFEIESETNGCFVSTEGFKFTALGKYAEVTDPTIWHRYDLVREVGYPAEGVHVKTLELTEQNVIKSISWNEGKIESFGGKSYDEIFDSFEKRITTLEQTLATLIAETKQMADNVIVFQETVSNALKEIVPFVLETRMKNGK